MNIWQIKKGVDMKMNGCNKNMNVKVLWQEFG